MDRSRPLYAPAVRMKVGELTGLSELADDIAECVLPRIIVPPRRDRDDLQQELLADESVPAIGPILSRYWVNRGALVDATYLIDDFGADKVDTWLPKAFENALSASVEPVPLASLADIVDFAPAYRVVANLLSGLRFAIRIPSGEMVGPGWRSDLLRGLERVGVGPSDCCILADFCDADFTQPEYVADVIQGALEALQDVGLWRQIAFQGTNFPEINPAEDSSYKLIARNEWTAWCHAVKFDPSTGDQMIFGDYVADSARMSFGGNGGRAIRHLRYATKTHWLVQRGAKSGTDAKAMKEVCKSIVSSGYFAGRAFSAGDDFIYLTAMGARPGNATKWRAVNTNHHITRVVTDIGAVRDMRFAERRIEEIGEQASLFAS